LSFSKYSEKFKIHYMVIRFFLQNPFLQIEEDLPW
jgi:hypothetical protein